MTSKQCDCCETTGERSTDGGHESAAIEAELRGERAERPLSAVDLPNEVAAAAETLFASDDPVDTLGAFVDELHAAFGEEHLPFSIDTLCTAESSETWGETAGETYHFLCVQDALMLPEVLGDETVEVRTTSPISGTEIHATVTTEGIEVTPPDAVLSFGTTREPDVRGISTLEAAYESICPYVHAFPTFDEYESWTEVTPAAATIAIPFDRGFDLTHELVNANGER